MLSGSKIKTVTASDPNAQKLMKHLNKEVGGKGIRGYPTVLAVDDQGKKIGEYQYGRNAESLKQYVEGANMCGNNRESGLLGYKYPKLDKDTAKWCQSEFDYGSPLKTYGPIVGGIVVAGLAVWGFHRYCWKSIKQKIPYFRSEEPDQGDTAQDQGNTQKLSGTRDSKRDTSLKEPGTNWWIIGGLGLVVLVIIAVVVFFFLRGGEEAPENNEYDVENPPPRA